MAGQLLSSADLSTVHDRVLLDLDGVVYLLGEPIAGAPETIGALRDRGVAVRFVTNNASRRAEAVADLLCSKGIPADANEVATSAQAAAGLLKQRCSQDGKVLVLGSDALAEELDNVGLQPVRNTRDVQAGEVEAVVQGFGPDLRWADLAEGAVLIRSGALWVATNTDLTMPSPRGLLPGNGTLVATIAAAVGRRPDLVAGKPQRTLFDTAIHGASMPIVVGDRWDTDIAGAAAAELPALLVLSGATTPAEVLRIPDGSRPQYLAHTIAGLREVHPEVMVDAAAEIALCGGWKARVDGEDLYLDGNGRSIDALRALSEAAWLVNDRSSKTEVAADVRAVNDEAAGVLRELDLGS